MYIIEKRNTETGHVEYLQNADLLRYEVNINYAKDFVNLEYARITLTFVEMQSKPIYKFRILEQQIKWVEVT